jgi:uncharacterized protein
MTLFKPVKTPCIGVCSTGIGDAVCRGCKRFSHEVIDWNAYDHEQRLVIAQRLERFLSQVVRNHVEIVDQDVLRQQMTLQQIRFNPEQDPHCWVFELLRAGASQIHDPAHFGVRVLPPDNTVSLKQLRDLIDREYYELSCAYYDRYIAPQFSTGKSR